MKKLSAFAVLIFIYSIASAQFIYKIKADTVLITNDSCNAELAIENSTRAVVGGFLYNWGNGRTRFQKALVKINDSVYLVGTDTLHLAAGLGSLIATNGLTKTGNTIKLGGNLVDATTTVNMNSKYLTF